MGSLPMLIEKDAAAAARSAAHIGSGAIPSTGWNVMVGTRGA